MKETTVPAQTEEQREDLPQEGTREESRMLTPPVDIFEIEDGLAVVVDLPGVDKDHIDIDVNDHILTIRGRVQPEDRGEPLYREFELRDFYRQFQLSEEIDQEKIRADMKHGVLTIHLPKVERAKPRRVQVNVQGQ